MRKIFPFLILLLLAVPLHAQKPPSLVDRLMTLLGDGGLQPIEIQPPAVTAPAPAKMPHTEPGQGLELATSFLPIYDLEDTDAETAPEKPMLLPFFASGPVNKKQRNILSLVVMIPDSDREAARAYAFARAAQDEASANFPAWYAGNALVIAPQFLNPEDVAANKDRWPDGGKSLLTWAGAGWIYGADSAAEAAPGAVGAPEGMSSYEVLDFVLLALARKELFPDLERVVIAGGGAGGDFVQRYAALGLAPDALTGDGIKVRFIAANAWSYMYFDKTRAQLGDNASFTPAEGQTVFAEPKAGSCANYNVYPYGLEALPPYGRRQGEASIRLRYDSRVVLYLAGKKAVHPLPDSSPQACALILQGHSLNQRAQVFYQHLSRLYGDNLPATQRLYEVPEAGEEAPALWRGACGLKVLYGDGSCATETGEKLRGL